MHRISSLIALLIILRNIMIKMSSLFVNKCSINAKEVTYKTYQKLAYYIIKDSS